jgi:hypothetical protein
MKENERTLHGGFRNLKGDAIGKKLDVPLG